MYHVINECKKTPPGGLEPPTFRLTAERASQLRHGGSCELVDPQCSQTRKYIYIDFKVEFLSHIIIRYPNCAEVSKRKNYASKISF
uniref:Uncharacterized protein n=1 Tax=Trichogramma kaykai TaxID=54128 RepID=A0ABD2W7Z9_9HYME